MQHAFAAEDQTAVALFHRLAETLKSGVEADQVHLIEKGSIKCFIISEFFDCIIAESADPVQPVDTRHPRCAGLPHPAAHGVARARSRAQLSDPHRLCHRPDAI